MPHLPIEHRRQEERAGCLAACAQMALQHIHIHQSQSQLNRLVGLSWIHKRAAPLAQIPHGLGGVVIATFNSRLRRQRTTPLPKVFRQA